VTARFIAFRGWSGNPAYVDYLIFRTGMADDYYSEKDTGQRSVSILFDHFAREAMAGALLSASRLLFFFSIIQKLQTLQKVVLQNRAHI